MLCVIAGASVSLLTNTLATAADVRMPAQFRPVVACMIRALRSEPHISGARGGMSEAQLSLNAPPVPHPFVAYRTVGRDGHSGTIRFDARISGGQIYFETRLSGLSAMGGPGPDDWGTGRVIDLWKAKCRVGADAAFD